MYMYKIKVCRSDVLLLKCVPTYASKCIGGFKVMQVGSYIVAKYWLRGVRSDSYGQVALAGYSQYLQCLQHDEDGRKALGLMDRLFLVLILIAIKK